MIVLKSREELAKIRKASKIVAVILKEIEEMIRPDVTTEELDRFAEERIRSLGGVPAFKGYRGYQATLCTSINEEVVHGIPSKRSLKNGDIIGIDCGAIADGYYGDAAVTFPVGQISEESAKLIQATRKALESGIQMMRVGNRLGDVSYAVQCQGDAYSYGIVMDFVGHGIGRALHEEPQVPNYGSPHTGIRLSPGLVLAIEPMFNLGTHLVKVLDDGWTAVTTDGRRSAHFEHTVAVTESGPEVLTVL
ncbi:MAG: type I methionyl aminopeptidase [Deltaproteobacteria bacterium]|nr:type I methionyl aminopeptidase [Deltaproteobacteria bacterium]MBI4196458.1 type I methionyl aminopeptidase [Deltaproteobacteria bacterium]